MESGEAPRVAELMQSAKALTLTLAGGKRIALVQGVGSGWQSWSKGEKFGVVAAAVLVAVGVMVVLGTVIFVNRRRRIRQKKKKEKEERKRKKREKRKREKNEKLTKGPRDIKMVETVRNGPTAPRSSHGDSKTRKKHGKSSQADKPLMMSGVLQDS